MEDIIPRHIILNNFIYTYKDALKDQKYTYRCKHRTVSKLTIKIDKVIIRKYNYNLLKDIKFSYINNTKEHTCQKLKKDNDIIESNNNSISHNKELAKSLKNINIDKPLSFHVLNLEKNNIKLSKIQIKIYYKK
jgi:hypothetical protein